MFNCLTVFSDSPHLVVLVIKRSCGIVSTLKSILFYYLKTFFVMGRQKNTPKKVEDVAENFGYRDYVPVFKKRKRKTSNTKNKFFNIQLYNSDLEKFYIGDIIIGHTSNIFPNEYTDCRVSFKTSETEQDELDTTIIVECDKISMIIIKSYGDVDFLKGESTTNIPKKNIHGATEIVRLYEKLWKTRETSFSQTVKENVQHPYLKPILRPYQGNSVRWMLFQERNNKKESNQIHPLSIPITLKSGLTIYLDKYTGYISLDKPVIPPSSNGGILADEMGLGKTVEVLACILLNPKYQSCQAMTDDVDMEVSPVVVKQSKKRKLEIEQNESPVCSDQSKKLKIPNDWVKPSSRKSSTYTALKMWYDSILSDVGTVSTPAKEVYTISVQCTCGSTSEEDIVECDSCGKYQHKKCLGYNRSLGRYLCPQCWMDEPLLEYGATLIVTPFALRSQWCKEICRHIKGKLKVLLYEGCSATPVYPTQLKEYDIVLTTYSVLQNELRLTEHVQLLAPLYTLRHACTYPNTTRGRYLATKKQVTSMKDLLNALIMKNTNDSEDCLRLIIASLNALVAVLKSKNSNSEYIQDGEVHINIIECLKKEFKTPGDHIQCSVCRNKQKYEEISYIKAGNTVADADCKTIKGNYSTKIEAVIKLLMDLREKNPDVKVLVFSSWVTVLKCLMNAFQCNSISCELLAQGRNLENKISNFKDPTKKVTVLLLPVSLGSKGLNLIEATHVILVEPLLNPADELQAIGRVNRIGQTNNTSMETIESQNSEIAPAKIPSKSANNEQIDEKGGSGTNGPSTSFG
ncbi:hypothetical protein JTB14_035541 [Gonioctena quinquepunctata]|nr:hypothetical protein JTB14_035541 [Gonioctena quinquepunctata]